MSALDELQSQLADFQSLSEKLRGLMNGALDLMQAGRVPTGNDGPAILNAIYKLQEKYDAIYTLALNGSLKECLPGENLPVEEYVKIIRANVQREENERARSRLEHFSGVKARIDEYYDALAPFQQHTREILDSQNMEAILGALESPDLFMKALTEGVSVDSLSLLESIGQNFNQRVMLGLALGAYFDPDAPKVPNVTVLDSNTTITKTVSTPGANITTSGEAQDSEETGSGLREKKLVAVNQAVLKSSKPGASTFLGEVASLTKSAPDVLVVLPFLMRFGILNLSQLLAFYQWCSGHPADAHIVEPSYQELHDRVLAALDTLTSKGFVAQFEGLGENDNPDESVFWCLSNYTAGCMKKEKVIQQKTRTGISQWRVPYNPNTCCLLSSSGTVSETIFQNCRFQNEILALYFKWLNGSLPLKVAAVIKSIKWKGERYQVEVPVEGGLSSCIVAGMNGDDVAENLLVVYGMTILPEKFAPQCKRLFVLKNGKLYVCKPPVNEGDESVDEQLRRLPPIDPDPDGPNEPDPDPAPEPDPNPDPGDTGPEPVPEPEPEPEFDDNITPPDDTGGNPDSSSSGSSFENLDALEKEPTDLAFYSAAVSMLDKADALIANGDEHAADSEILHAALLSKAASLEKKYSKSATLSTELQLATNILFRSDTQDTPVVAYTSDCLLDCKNRAAFDPHDYTPVFQLTAAMFSMLVPETSQDYALNFQNQDLFQHYDEEFCLEHPELRLLKPLFGRLLEVRNVTPSGFSTAVLAHLGNETENEAIMNAMRARAKKLMHIPPRDVKALEILYHKRFGESSPIYRCLDIIAAKQDQVSREDLDFVKSVLEPYCEPELVVNQDAVNEDIDAMWEESLAFMKGKVKPLVATRRVQTERAFNERLELMAEWAAHVDAIQSNELDLPSLKRLRGELVDLIEKARDGLGRSRSAVLDLALRRMLAILTLNGKDLQVFTELLTTGVLPMNEPFDGKLAGPDFSGCPLDVKYYEPWRNVLRHIKASSAKTDDLKTALEKIRAEILEGAALNKNGRGDNLHQLALIDQMLELGDGISPEDEQSARNLANSMTEDFRRELEVANVYNQIGLEQKLRLEGYLDEYQESFFDSGDFACWRDFLRALEQQLQDCTNESRAQMQDRLDAIKASNPDDLTGLVQTCETCIDAGNFLIAEELMNRIESSDPGGLTSASDSDKTDVPRYFTDFLGVFAPLYTECQAHSNELLKKFGVEWFQKRLPGQVQSREWPSCYYQGLPEDGRELLRNWPSRGGNATPAQVQLLFKQLGFDVSNTTLVKDDANSMILTSGIDRFQLNLAPDTKSETGGIPLDLGDSLDVLVLYGRPTEQQIVDLVNASTSGNDKGISFVLLDAPLTLINRRSIGEIVKRQCQCQSDQESKPFLLIDQVLVLYLATLTTRIPALLQCTLPYTAYNPFATARDEIPEREAALAELFKSDGRCLVYGGDQLGKTSLLHRALHQTGDNDPAFYCIYCNVDTCNTDTELTMQLAVELRDKTGLNFNLNLDLNLSLFGLFGDSESSFEQLCRKILERFKNGNIKQLFLGLDNADKLLKSGYITGILTTLLGLRQKTSGAFQFVLGSLHNPAAILAALPQDIREPLGDPLLLRPLSRLNANRLLAHPLSFVGFELGREFELELETLAVHTNYYPGLLNFMGRQIALNLNKNYAQYYGENDNLPFTLRGDGLSAVLGSPFVNQHIRDVFMKSINIDRRYFMLACAIAWVYHMHAAQDQVRWNGATLEEILDAARENDLRCLEDEPHEGGYRGLLDEMCSMGVLVRVGELPNEKYRLARRRFVDFIGHTPDVLIDAMLASDTKGGRSDV